MTYEFVSEKELPSFQHFDLEPLTGALGGMVSGLDLASDLSDGVIAELYSALLDYKVLFFRDQPMNEDQHLRLARKFGTPQGPGSIPQPDGYPGTDTHPDERTTDTHASACARSRGHR